MSEWGTATAELGARSDPATNAAFDGLPLADCIGTYRRWLHLPDPGPIYATLAAVAANLAPGDPVWLALVGPPGSGRRRSSARWQHSSTCTRRPR